MRASPVDLIGGYYKSDSLPWACQDTVNWLPVMAEVEGTRSLKMLETPPGLKPYQQIGTGPIRGMHDCEGLRLIVSGRYLYRITNAGVGVPIGVIPGVGRVSMTHNQFETGYQVLVENGQPGGGYVYSTVDQTFVRITDEGYPGSISSDYLDSFLLGVEPFGRFWFHSDLASATSYNTLDRYEAEASPDKIVGLAVSGQEVVVFGQRTTEFFMNVGAATGTFQNRNTGFDRGCASRDTIVKLDNSIFWLGDDGIVYRLNGYSAQPVSTRALEQQLSRYNLAQAFAFVWEDRGHKVYYLTFPDGQTFGYDVVTGLWHRRESFGLDRWRLTHVVEWSGRKYGGDFQSGRVFLIDWDYHLEGSQPIISERVSPVLTDSQSRLGIPSAELIFDTGQGPLTEPIPFPEQPPSPQIAGDAPDVVIGDNYPGFAYTLSSGLPPYVVTLVDGALPSPLTISSAGVISTGTLTAIGGSRFTLRVTDANGLWTELDDEIYATSAVLSLGNTVSSTKTISRRSLAATWSLANAGVVPRDTVNIMGLPSGRFLAWGATATYYSDNVGTSWTATTAATAGTGGSYLGDCLDARVVLGGGGTGDVFTSTNSGTSFTTRPIGSSLQSHGCLFVKSGDLRGRIIGFPAGANNLCRVSDNDGVSFATTVATTVNRSGGGSLMSTLSHQYVGGADVATLKPKVVALVNGATIARTLILSSAANGYVAALCSFPFGNGNRILMGTNTGAIYYSDDNLATFRQATFSVAAAVRTIRFNGKNVIVGCDNNSSGSTFSSMDGLTYVPETNTNVYSLLMLGVNM